MPNPLNIGSITGTDNIAPIYNPNGRWQTWNLDEIYLGTVGSGKYIPKINDVVVQVAGTNLTFYVVVDINATTLVAVLRQATGLEGNGTFTDQDILLGVGPGTQSDTYRMYVDKSVTPYKINVDARLKVAGTMCSWCKIFKGSDIGANGIVISRMYDQNGTLLSENIPLEVAATDLLINTSIKVVSPAFTNSDLQDGEVVTAVLYDNAGFVVSVRQLLVKNTAFIRSTDSSKKYIVGIALKSPFLSVTNDRLINYPINVPLNGLNLTGQVTYSNGEVIEYPVDGTKFSIFGFETYVATLVGQTIPLVLKYSVAPNEIAYNLTVGSDLHIAEQYTATTLNLDGSYNIKLFAYPVWIDDISGYRMEYYMYNLDRNIKYNVTPYVSINTNISLFNPTLYGTMQRLSVSLNIRNANNAYVNYIHVQSIDVVLNKRGSERPNNWTIGYNPDQSPRYGVNTFATAFFINTNVWKVKVNSGYTDLPTWLTNIYQKTLPLFNASTELVAPDPNFFAIINGGNRFEYPIASWNDDIIINGTVVNSSTLFVEFFKRTNTNDLRLAVAGLPMYYVDSSNNYI
jgi:hypothetical protein